MSPTEIRLKQVLKNIYNYANANDGQAPPECSPLYGQFKTVEKIINEIEKTNYNEAQVMRKRFLEGKAFQEITFELAYERAQIFRFRARGEELFVKKAIELELVK